RVRLQAVWFGRNPYVIDEHGKRVYPGAMLADDWTLESIEGDQVRLVRGQERFAFTL
ncbi:SctD/MshK family protein, partial [Pseudomonas syringae pv. coryli]